jgi:hypothetical protein
MGEDVDDQREAQTQAALADLRARWPGVDWQASLAPGFVEGVVGHGLPSIEWREPEEPGEPCQWAAWDRGGSGVAETAIGAMARAIGLEADRLDREADEDSDGLGDEMREDAEELRELIAPEVSDG